MAYKITDLTGVTVAPGGDYPFGDVKNAPGGTLVDKKMMDDMLQFFQKLMNWAGITPNSTADNVTHGYQLLQAFFKNVNGEAAALGQMSNFGTNVAVNASGMAVTTVGSTSTISEGWFVYNDKFVYFPLQTLTPALPPIGDVAVVTISATDGLPTATIAWAPTVTSATQFPFNAMFMWQDIVGITALNSEVATLQANVAFGAWTDVPLATGWTHGTRHFQYRTDGKGRVYLRGQCIAGGTYTLLVANLPPGVRPTQITVPIVGGIAGGAYTVGGIADINPDGTIYDVAISPAVGDSFNFDGVVFLNT